MKKLFISLMALTSLTAVAQNPIVPSVKADTTGNGSW